MLCGRGATAEFVALRVAHEFGQDRVIVPDVICPVVIESALLAGCGVRAGEVDPQRFTLALDAAQPEAKTVVLTAHTFGHVSQSLDNSSMQNYHECITIDDAVQGLGGELPHGATMTFTSFDPSKMVGGRGAALLTDDPALWDAMQRVALTPVPPLAALPPHLHAHALHLHTRAADLLRPFDAAPENIDRINEGLRTLAARVEARNAKAAWLRAHLDGLPLVLPAVEAGDAIWRYTIAAPTPLYARRLLRALAESGLRASDNYLSVSKIYGLGAIPPNSAALAGRLLNLWVDETVTQADLERTVKVIRRTLASFSPL